MKELLIFDPKEHPFGFLSDNCPYSIPIKHQTWPTVTNYIYASLLHYPTNKNIVRNTSIREIKDVTNELLREEITMRVSQAIQQALNAKMADPSGHFLEALVKTENRPIEYRQPEEEQDDIPALLVKYLYQARHVYKVGKNNIERGEKIQERMNDIYERYFARKIIMESINSLEDIRKYYNKTPKEIIKISGKTIIPEAKDAVIEKEIKKNHPNIIEDIAYVDHPDSLVPSIMMEYIGFYAEKRSAELRIKILDFYLDYILGKEYRTLSPDQYPTAKKEQLQQLSVEKRVKYANIIWELYRQGNLSGSWSTQADYIVDDWYIPTQEEIITFQNYAMPEPTEKPNFSHKFVPRALTGAPAIIYSVDKPIVSAENKQFLPLSPYYDEMFDINGYKFRTIWQYIYAILLSNVTDGFSTAYKNFIYNSDKQEFLSKADVEKIYMQKTQEHRNKTLVDAAKIALEIKFEFKDMADILIMTGNAKLIWNDPSEHVLGVGENGRGENQVGQILERIRHDINEERKKYGDVDKEINVALENINELFRRDLFIYQWFNMRIADMCKIIRIIKHYAETRFDSQIFKSSPQSSNGSSIQLLSLDSSSTSQDEFDVFGQKQSIQESKKKPKKIEITPEFVSTVLDKIYQPCSYVYKTAENVTANAPDIISNMVRNNEEFTKISPAIIEVIWKRLAVLLFNAINLVKHKTMKNIREVISIAEQLARLDDQIYTEFADSRQDNRIITAILNVIQRIIDFNKYQGYYDSSSVNIGSIEVKTAIRIILGANISKNVCPDIKIPIPKHATSKYIQGKDYVKDYVKDGDVDSVKGQDYTQLQIDNEDDVYYQEDDDIYEEYDDADDEDYSVSPTDFDEDDFEEYSPVQNAELSLYIKEEFKIDNPSELVNLIQMAVYCIKNWKMSNIIKENRINFFASQKT